MADNFANRILLSGLAPSTSGSNIGATGEVGEPIQSGTTNSDWWSWTAPHNGTFSINTKNSNLDTYLSVFTGSAVNNLTLIAQNDDAAADFTSLVTFNTTAGITYQIAVDGFSTYTGNFQLNIVPVVINGTPNNDTLTGSAYSETINGLAGNDHIIGGEGNDTLSSGDGSSHILDGGLGADRFIGGSGRDRYEVDNVGDVVVDELPSPGVFDIVLSSVTYTLPAEIEYLTLTGTAGVIATGNNLNNIIEGNSGNNTLNGLAGDDNLLGKDGNDIIYGGDGIDNLEGGLGVDQLIGGLGNDRYGVDNTGDVVQELPDQGIDVVASSVTYTLPAEVENLYLNGTAAINGTGNNLPNTITGNAGNNTLNGGAGPDTLDGGGGQDILTGSTGANTFFFAFGESSVSASDHITDFEIGSSKIDLWLSGLPNSFSRAANSAAATLSDVVAQAFSDANGGLIGTQALGTNSAALIVATNASITGNYLVINDATAGFQASNDLVIKLTTAGAFPPVGAIPVASFFV